MNRHSRISNALLAPIGLVLGLASIPPCAVAAQSSPLTEPAPSQAPAPTTNPAPPPTSEVSPAVQSEILALKPVVNDADLWDRVRRGFQMKELDSPLVRQQEKWYAARPDYIERFVERGSKYLYHIVEEVERRGLPTEIVLLPIIESAFNPQAYSRAHASGMWQFIPSTGKNYGLQQNWLADNRRDVLLSTNAALDYLSMLYRMFGSWDLAFAAYNCGEGCVGRAIAYNRKRGKPTNFSSLRLPNETRSYVPRLIAVRNIVFAPNSFGINLTSVQNKPYFAQVAAPEQIDVKLAARLAEMEVADFAALNPASIKPVAASATGFFLVPTEKAVVFRENLELYRSLNGPMVSWQTAEAKRGDAVEAVAKKHGMTASYLRATSGPFKERKGKFLQPTTFLVPSSENARAIVEALDRKVELRNGSGPALAAPPILSASAADPPRAVGEAPLPLPPPTAQSSLALPAFKEPTSTKTYRVKSGDTLFSIAQQHDTDIAALKRDNRLQGDAIRIGQLIKIEGGIAGDKQVTSALAAPRKSTATPKPQTVYTIRAGDTLSGIADKFSMPLARLMAANNLDASSIIQPGRRLRLVAQ